MPFIGMMDSLFHKVIAQDIMKFFYNTRGTYPHIRCLIVGKYYLVDDVYACKPGFLPPFRGARYHLSEYGSRNRPTNAENYTT
jgi:hypothetical protein